MLRDDYLLRLIEQIGRVIARIRELLLKGEVVRDTELKEAAAAAGQDLGLLRLVTTETLSSMLSPTGRTDATKSVLVAELLFADLLIVRSEGDEAAVQDRLAKIQAMLSAAARDEDPVRRSLVKQRIAALLEMAAQEGVTLTN